LKDRKLRSSVSSEVSTDVPKIFNDGEPSWEKLNIGLWLKTFKVNL